MAKKNVELYSSPAGSLSSFGALVPALCTMFGGFLGSHLINTLSNISPENNTDAKLIIVILVRKRSQKKVPVGLLKYANHIPMKLKLSLCYLSSSHLSMAVHLNLKGCMQA